MDTKNDLETIYARTRGKWRAWLGENCQSKKSVRLIIYHKKSKTASVHFREAIEEAVCFGWVDSKANKREDAHNEVIPEDLQKRLTENKTAFSNFQKFSPSSKRIILEWILKAKRPETRQRRIAQTVELAAKNIKANH